MLFQIQKWPREIDREESPHYNDDQNDPMVIYKLMSYTTLSNDAIKLLP